MGQIVLVGIGGAVGKGHGLGQITGPPIGVFAGIDEHQKICPEIFRGLVLSGDKQVGQRSGGVGAAQLVAVDAVGHPGYGLGPGQILSRGFSGLPGIQECCVSLFEPGQIRDGGFVRNCQDHHGATFVAEAVFQELGPGRSVGQGPVEGQDLFRPQRALSGFDAGHGDLGRHIGIENSTRKKLFKSDRLHPCIETVG